MKTSIRLLAAFFVVGGAAHFAFTDAYVRVVPPWLPDHLALVIVSGICEIAGGIGVLVAATRRAAGVGLVLLSIAVFPANVQMLLDAHAENAALPWQGLLLLRLPLQLALIYWIVKATGVIASGTASADR